jgi:phage-related baseplate assembly protein
VVDCSVSDRPLIESDVLVALLLELHAFQIIAKLEMFATPAQFRCRMTAGGSLKTYLFTKATEAKVFGITLCPKD